MLQSLLNFFRKYVLKNLPFKLVSLAIAILLWWVVGRDSAIEIPMTVPLEFQHAPDNLEINSDYPLQAQVTLRGPERLLQEMRPSAGARGPRSCKERCRANAPSISSAESGSGAAQRQGGAGRRRRSFTSASIAARRGPWRSSRA